MFWKNKPTTLECEECYRVTILLDVECKCPYCERKYRRDEVRNLLFNKCKYCNKEVRIASCSYCESPIALKDNLTVVPEDIFTICKLKRILTFSERLALSKKKRESEKEEQKFVSQFKKKEEGPSLAKLLAEIAVIALTDENDNFIKRGFKFLGGVISDAGKKYVENVFHKINHINAKNHAEIMVDMNKAGLLEVEVLEKMKDVKWLAAKTEIEKNKADVLQSYIPIIKELPPILQAYVAGSLFGKWESSPNDLEYDEQLKEYLIKDKEQDLKRKMMENDNLEDKLNRNRGV